ncbi:LysM peptidoglycan-binding domain-containing protein [Paenarthrobacter nitroguajacolicus]|uniref:LysM peptidoglycan-binding domain-containing protein n=1 Tax=Paenarthrobacter nitroguajacolicus TaxID=211146 RepID=A0A558H912_PAENT|nr:LysM peptidoglycan-binding domain-containing protein [Paenarthrobacter nitroguajacolicus]TVU65618.1 LysM peptidoglycan-binding domain-containing protein [Paenarthrobacter nitroguajacolicus]
MGLLDNLKKNLGFGDKDHSVPAAPETGPVDTAASQAAEDAAAVEVATLDRSAAEAAAAQAAAQQEAADVAGVQAARQVEADVDGAQEAQAAQEAHEATPGAPAEGGGTAAAAPRVTEVVVEPGDTMGGIAAQFGVDLGALIASNADTVPNPDLIYPGQVLRLP